METRGPNKRIEAFIPTFKSLETCSVTVRFIDRNVIAILYIYFHGEYYSLLHVTPEIQVVFTTVVGDKITTIN